MLGLADFVTWGLNIFSSCCSGTFVVVREDDVSLWFQTFCTFLFTHPWFIFTFDQNSMVWYVLGHSIVLHSSWNPRACYWGAVPNPTRPVSQKDYLAHCQWFWLLVYGFWLWDRSSSALWRAFHFFFIYIFHIFCRACWMQDLADSFQERVLWYTSRIFFIGQECSSNASK